MEESLGKNIGTIENTYFAGKATFNGGNVGVIVGTNTGTVSYSYHDSTIISIGMNTTGSTGITTANFRTLAGITTSTPNVFRQKRTIVGGTTYMYPTLCGFIGTGTDVNPFIIDSPATLLYFPFSYEYTRGGMIYKITNDIDMNLLAKNAYLPGENSKYLGANSKIDASVSGSDIGNSKYINGSYSIINLTINTPILYVVSNVTYVLFAFMPYTGSGVVVSNLNFIGGKVDLSEFDFSPYFLRDKTAVYAATLFGNNTGSSSAFNNVINVHTSCDITLGDGNFMPYVSVSGIGGTGGSVLTNVSNSGDIYGGIHPYSTIYEDLIDSTVYTYISGISSSSSIVKAENVVNFGEIVGPGYYGTSTYDSNFMGNTEMERIIYTRINGVFGYTTTHALFKDNFTTAKVANFGDIYDVPYVISNGKPISKAIPAGTNYINYGNIITGVASGGISFGSIADPEIGNGPKLYNEGNITNLATRNVTINGVNNATSSNYTASSLYNKGDITTYCGFNTINGLSSIANLYNSQNDGNITAYYINRSATQNSAGNSYINGAGHVKNQDCVNNGNIYVNLEGAQNTEVVSSNTAKRFYISGVGNGATTSSVNNGDITVVAGDLDTGWTPVNITASDFKVNNKGANTDTTYYDAAGRKNYTLYIRGVTGAQASNCSNYGDIKIENTPDSFLTQYVRYR